MSPKGIQTNMNPVTFFNSFQVPPFGFEGEGDQGGDQGQGGNDQGQGQGQQQQQQQQGTQSGSAGKGNVDDDDDDDDYKGLTPAQLKAKLKEEASARKAAEKVKADLEAEQDKAARAKNDELTNTKNDLSKVNEERDSLVATNKHLALINAILNDSDYSWHNVEIVAQQIVQAGKVEVDAATGGVTGLKKELKRIAESDAYLLKSAQQGNQGGQGNSGQRGGYGSTGIQPGQGGANNGGQQQHTVDELAKNYPALAALRLGNSRN